jgi:hypothetical protein
MSDRLAEFEVYIKSRALSYANRHDDIQDFQQIGRIAAWAALLDDPKATKSYVHRRIEWRMKDYWKRGVYKDPEEISANEHYSNVLYGEYVYDDNTHW